MSHKLFNKKEVKPLIANPYVKNISEKGALIHNQCLQKIEIYADCRGEA
ncbi:MAG TPA: hypothetical protein VGI33_08895 [Paenibacillus sp.]